MSVPKMSNMTTAEYVSGMLNVAEINCFLVLIFQLSEVSNFIFQYGLMVLAIEIETVWDVK